MSGIETARSDGRIVLSRTRQGLKRRFQQMANVSEGRPTDKVVKFLPVGQMSPSLTPVFGVNTTRMNASNCVPALRDLLWREGSRPQRNPEGKSPDDLRGRLSRIAARSLRLADSRLDVLRPVGKERGQPCAESTGTDWQARR